MNDQHDDPPITLRKKKATGQFDPGAAATLARPEAGGRQFAQPFVAAELGVPTANSPAGETVGSKADLVNVTFKTDKRTRDEFMIYCRRQGVTAQSLLETFVTEKAKLSNS